MAKTKRRGKGDPSRAFTKVPRKLRAFLRRLVEEEGGLSNACRALGRKPSDGKTIKGWIGRGTVRRDSDLDCVRQLMKERAEKQSTPTAAVERQRREKRFPGPSQAVNGQAPLIQKLAQLAARGQQGDYAVLVGMLQGICDRLDRIEARQERSWDQTHWIATQFGYHERELEASGD